MITLTKSLSSVLKLKEVLANVVQVERGRCQWRVALLRRQRE